MLVAAEPLTLLAPAAAGADLQTAAAPRTVAAAVGLVAAAKHTVAAAIVDYLEPRIHPSYIAAAVVVAAAARIRSAAGCNSGHHLVDRWRSFLVHRNSRTYLSLSFE